MKKFLLSLVAVAGAFAANANPTPYWFTVNVETQAQPTGAGKVYCSFESADAAKANETTTTSKHFSANVTNNNWSAVGQTVLLYAEGEGNYTLDHYEVNGQRVNVTNDGYGDGYRITMSQANRCGAGSLSEEDCIAQHSADLAGVVTHIVGVFKEVEKCWFYASAVAEQVEGGTVSVSFDGLDDVKKEVVSNATVHFNKNIDAGDYSAVTRNLYVHAVADNGYELESVTVGGAQMNVDPDGTTIAFVRMSAANKCGDGALTEEECLANHNAENLPAPIVVSAKFKKVPAVTFEVDQTNYNEETGAYDGEVSIKVNTENLPEGSTVEYSIENREDSEASSMLKEDVEWLPLPEDGVITLKHSAILTIVVKDAEGEEIVSNEIEVKVNPNPVTGVNDLKVNGTNVTKVVENGQVIIVKGETRFNTMGQSIK